jgi:hypothetical protein
LHAVPCAHACADTARRHSGATPALRLGTPCPLAPMNMRMQVVAGRAGVRAGGRQPAVHARGPHGHVPPHRGRRVHLPQPLQRGACWRCGVRPAPACCVGRYRWRAHKRMLRGPVPVACP